MKSVNTVSIIENPSQHRREFTSHSAISCAKKNNDYTCAYRCFTDAEPSLSSIKEKSISVNLFNLNISHVKKIVQLKIFTVYGTSLDHSHDELL